MKIIELLNKIANEEEVPRKIAYGDIPYVYVGSNRDGIKYVNEEHDFNEGSRYLMYMIDDLNDEVEILEEEKKTKPLTKKDIEALGYACGEIQKCFTNGWTKSLENKPLEEEKKIPEKLFFTHISNYNDQSVVNNNFNNYFKKTQETINQLIDYLKSKGE